jgi:hypothetical protein
MRLWCDRILVLWMRLYWFFWALCAAKEKGNQTLDELEEHEVVTLLHNRPVSSLHPSMHSLSLTLLLFILCPAVLAGNSTQGHPCSVGNSRLQIGTYQFWDECNILTYCSEKGICEAKGCRKDEYPFGFPRNSSFPSKCPTGQFCPDEGSQCQPLLPVGSPCQLNRDGMHYRCLTTPHVPILSRSMSGSSRLSRFDRHNWSWAQLQRIRLSE